MFEKWKEKRAIKKAIKDPFLVEEQKLLAKLKELEPGTDEYREMQNELKMTSSIRAETKESKRRISKSDKGNIIIRTISFLGAGLGIGSIIWAETRGMTFTGEKRKFMDSISSCLGKVFFNR